MRVKPLGVNKTEIDLEDGRVVLVSYQTPVALKTRVQGYTHYTCTQMKWSATTSRHIKAWIGGNPAVLRSQGFFNSLLQGV